MLSFFFSIQQLKKKVHHNNCLFKVPLVLIVISIWFVVIYVFTFLCVIYVSGASHQL